MTFVEPGQQSEFKLLGPSAKGSPVDSEYVLSRFLWSETIGSGTLSRRSRMHRNDDTQTTTDHDQPVPHTTGCIQRHTFVTSFNEVNSYALVGLYSSLSTHLPRPPRPPRSSSAITFNISLNSAVRCGVPQYRLK
jgi:hypothetical protein